ncbi:MAG: hypothetical protein AAGA93_00570 [Actinomycetota bacterium]
MAGVSPGERVCRRALTFLLNEIDPGGWSTGRLEEFARLLDALPHSYQVKARQQQTTAVARLIRHRELTGLCGMDGQQVMPGEVFDEIRTAVHHLTEREAS